jgi:uncharacterized RDD family membrane protein YckC
MSEQGSPALDGDAGLTRPALEGYAGLVTRAVALLVDALVINAIAVVVGGALNLIASLLGYNGGLNLAQALVGGVAWVFWVFLYFVVFWNLTGQTPGDRLLGIRVISANGERIRIRQAAVRFVGLVLSAIPLGAGFLPVLVDDQRRGFHDRIAHTVVRWYADELSKVPPPVSTVPPVETEPVPVPVVGHQIPIG